MFTVMMLNWLLWIFTVLMLRKLANYSIDKIRKIENKIELIDAYIMSDREGRRMFEKVICDELNDVAKQLDIVNVKIGNFQEITGAK